LESELSHSSLQFPEKGYLNCPSRSGIQNNILHIPEQVRII